MNEIQKSDIRLLEAFSCALSNKTVNWSEMPEKTVWKSIYRSAEEHKIFPMVMESISGSRFFVINPDLEMNYRFYLKRAETETYAQAGNFLLLYDFLLNKGLKPLVMKGIVCRSLYPQPEQRPSCDEDLFINQEDFYAYHQAMLEYGLVPVDPDQDFDKSFEVAYRSKESSLYIEVHKYLFPPESKVFSKWNTFFMHSKEAFPISIYGSTLYTMEPDRASDLSDTACPETFPVRWIWYTSDRGYRIVFKNIRGPDQLGICSKHYGRSAGPGFCKGNL